MRIQKVRQVQTPSRANQFDAGLDFFIPDDMHWETFTVHPGCHLKIPSGIKADVPLGCALVCLEKSGIATKGLIIGAKVVDAGYQGEIHIHVMNPTKDPVVIKAGQKIAQFILIPLLLPTVQVVEGELFTALSSRGEGGFGSTGDGLKPKPKPQPEIEMIDCDQCDGCGWYEGGPTLKTTCTVCKGVGKLPKITSSAHSFTEGGDDIDYDSQEISDLKVND
jgi:dUTP pyrophosphatase